MLHFNHEYRLSRHWMCFRIFSDVNIAQMVSTLTETDNWLHWLPLLLLWGYHLQCCSVFYHLGNLFAIFLSGTGTQIILSRWFVQISEQPCFFQPHYSVHIYSVHYKYNQGYIQCHRNNTFSMCRKIGIQRAYAESANKLLIYKPIFQLPSDY